MAKLAFQGTPVNTVGDLPKVGQTVNFSKLVKTDLTEISTDQFAGKFKVMNIFPSIDTGVCAASVRRFNKEASGLKNTTVINVSYDLPFALARFCGAEGIKNCETVSAFRSPLGKEWGLQLADSAFMGLMARAVVILSPDNKVVYTELVPDITQEPNYEAALKAIR